MLEKGFRCLRKPGRAGLEVWAVKPEGARPTRTVCPKRKRKKHGYRRRSLRTRRPSIKCAAGRLRQHGGNSVRVAGRPPVPLVNENIHRRGSSCTEQFRSGSRTRDRLNLLGRPRGRLSRRAIQSTCACRSASHASLWCKSAGHQSDQPQKRCGAN